MQSGFYQKKAFTKHTVAAHKPLFMKQSFTIQLHNLRFFANHGLYAGEDVLGNEFEVSAQLKLARNDKDELELDDTINYAKVYEIIRSKMQQRFGLLENLAIAIADDLQVAFPHCRSIRLDIKKLHPPIAHFKGSVGISYKRKMEV
jgi:7,8-dihydroneopterin aldolase/epimerase/oxygenase